MFGSLLGGSPSVSQDDTRVGSLHHFCHIFLKRKAAHVESIDLLMHGALFYDTLLMNLSGEKKRKKKNPRKNAYVELV